MGRTIIQPIGPLYGEVVNGTIFGRPNGSIYVPSANTITLSSDYEYIRLRTGWYDNVLVCDSSGNIKTAKVIAQSQDIASYIQLRVSDDPDFATYLTRTFAAGSFNLDAFGVAHDPDDDFITLGSTYYLKAVLVSSSGVDVAVSDVLELTGWSA